MLSLRIVSIKTLKLIITVNKLESLHKVYLANNYWCPWHGYIYISASNKIHNDFLKKKSNKSLAHWMIYIQ